MTKETIILGRTATGGQKAFIYSVMGAAPPLLATEHKDAKKILTHRKGYGNEHEDTTSEPSDRMQGRR